MVLLIGLAVLPLLAVSVIGVGQYRDVQASEQLVDDVREGMAEVEWLEDIRLAIVDERNWTITKEGAEEAGIPLPFISQLTGLDLVAEAAEAVDEVDRLLEGDLDGSVRRAVASYRASGTSDLFELGDTIEIVQNELGDRLEGVRSELLQAASEAPNGSEVVMAIRASDAASTARLQYARQLWAYVAAQFSEPALAGPLYLDLAEVRQGADEALALVTVIAPPDSGLTDAVDAIRSSPERREFVGAVEQALDQAFVDASQNGTAPNDILDEIGRSADVYRSGAVAVTVFDELVTVSDQVVDAASTGSTEAASERLRATMQLLALAAIVAVGIAVGIARYVGTPMIRLADAAKRLGTGEQLDLERRGPAEVRRVSDALRAAADGLALVERLEHEATHDELTGVATRRLVHRNLDRAVARVRRTGGLGAVMFIDIDHFKDVNDTHGHVAGDMVLVTMASRLGMTLRSGDELGRYGGDEFVVLAEPIEDEAGAIDLANRLLRAAAEPIDITPDLDDTRDRPAERVVVTLSIGVALFGSSPVASEDILRRADDAVYQAKAAGRDTVVSVGPAGPAPTGGPGSLGTAH